MRKINKDEAPDSLTQWCRDNPRGGYDTLDIEIKREIRRKCLQEQFYLCAHCCQSLCDEDNCHNEHIQAQGTSPQHSTDFANIVASCNIRKQCGDAHKSRHLPLTPLMEACEHELRFKISGRVEGLTDRAKVTIDVLNLGSNNKVLNQKRKQLSQAILLGHGLSSIEPEDDEELIEMLISDISTPIDGRLDSFAPVVVNILRSWLSKVLCLLFDFLTSHTIKIPNLGRENLVVYTNVINSV